MPTIRLSPWQLAVAAAIFIVAVSNGSLFAALVDGLDVHSIAGTGFLATLLLLMVLVYLQHMRTRLIDHHHHHRYHRKYNKCYIKVVKYVIKQYKLPKASSTNLA